MTITETTTIADIARALPTSVRVFQHHGIDFCCGGKKPIGAVCREQGLNFAESTSAIEASRDTVDSGTRDRLEEPLGNLTSHIMTTYHQPLREELPRLQGMAVKVARVHGEKCNISHDSMRS
jgi:regulator of cell morphogenesis and NO signaling